MKDKILASAVFMFWEANPDPSHKHAANEPFYISVCVNKWTVFHVEYSGFGFRQATIESCHGSVWSGCQGKHDPLTLTGVLLMAVSGQCLTDSKPAHLTSSWSATGSSFVIWSWLEFDWSYCYEYWFYLMFVFSSENDSSWLFSWHVWLLIYMTVDLSILWPI